MTKNPNIKRFLTSGDFVNQGGSKKVSVSLIGYSVNRTRAAKNGSHSVGMLFATTGMAFGLNANGQVGDASVVPKSSPVALSGNKTWAEMAAGGNSSGGIDLNGAAFSWGVNGSGQHGTGNVTPTSSPVVVAGNKIWRSYACGNAFSLLIDNTGLGWSMGLNANGQLGDNSVVPKSSPISISGNKTWYSLVAGSTHGLGIDQNRAGFAFGSNTAGELGDGTTTPRSSPVSISGNRVWAQLSGGNDHSAGIVIDTYKKAMTWGDNTNGQLGDGTVVSKSSPVFVSGFNYDPVGQPNDFFPEKIHAGTDSTYIIRDTGDAYSMGLNTHGQLGDGTQTPRSSPVLIPGNLKWIDVSAGLDFALLLRNDGSLYAMGNGANGRLGNNAVTSASSPVLVVGNQSWNFGGMVLINKSYFDVDPGQSYSVEINSTIVTFDGIPLGYALGVVPIVEVEYLN